VDQRRPNGEAAQWVRGVTAPNQMLGGYAHVGSSAPLEGALAPVVPGNQFFTGPMAQMGGTHSLDRSPSPVESPDHEFKVDDDVPMPQPQSAVKWTGGSVPVRPAVSSLAPSAYKRANI
jgi:hypothetical protein